MANPERSTVERVARISKVTDIIQAVFGLIIGGEVGLAIILVSGATYVIADRVEKRSRKQ